MLRKNKIIKKNIPRPDLKHSKAIFHSQSSGISACTNTLISCLQISKKLL